MFSYIRMRMMITINILVNQSEHYLTFSGCLVCSAYANVLGFEDIWRSFYGTRIVDISDKKVSNNYVSFIPYVSLFFNISHILNFIDDCFK